MYELAYWLLKLITAKWKIDNRFVKSTIDYEIDNYEIVNRLVLGLPTEKSKVHQFQICYARSIYLRCIHAFGENV